MIRRLPPLNALRGFEAAGRLGSFVKAAAELHVTPGAVSQQVRQIEDWLGRPLFQRHHRGITLTDAGRRYLAQASRILDDLAAATAELGREHAGHTIAVRALPAFAEKWLLPRLRDFRNSHPDVDINLATYDDLHDRTVGAHDLAFTYGEPQDPNVHCERLFMEDIFPACSPDLLGGSIPLETPHDLRHHALLHDTHWTDDWRHWLRAAGVEAIDLEHGSTFTLYSLAVQAALDGVGVIMAHRVLLAAELESGRLVAPFDLRVPAPEAFYMVTTPRTHDRPAVQAFRVWVRSQL